MAGIPTRAGRLAVERLTEDEATTFINNDKETIKTELNRLTFVPLAPRPADAPAGDRAADQHAGISRQSRRRCETLR